MAETALKVLWIFLLLDVSIAAVCLRYPLCYCSTNAQRDTKIFCKNVTDIKPIQYLLQRYDRVYSLRLVAPELNSLPSKAFSGHLITVLEIDGPLVDIPDDALADVIGLKIVNFIGGHFGTISSTFSNANFKTVQLVHGLLESIKDQLQNNLLMTDALLYDNKIDYISTDAFLNARSLEYLNLSHNLLSNLDPDIFPPIHQLKSIDLSNNKLLTVDGYFNNLNPMLIKLYGNNLTNIDNAFQSGMWSTKVLDIGGNPHLNISSMTFDNFRNLAILGLTDNNFDELDPYLLSHLIFLTKLSLNGNHLSSLPSQFFINTHRLYTLELAENDLSSVEDIFPVDDRYHYIIHSLKTVNLNSNKITSIRFGSSAKSILHLDLGRNLISHVLNGDLENLTSLTNLNLSGNSLSEVDAGCFKLLVNLQTLDLSHTNLKQLNHSVKGLGQMEEFIADSASLTSLDQDEFLGLNNLETISLKNNNLRSIYPALQNLTNLTTLDVSSNNMTTLSLSSLPTDEKNMVKLKKLWMADNPFSCDCRLSWILDWLKVKGSTLEDEPTCQSPGILQGRPIRSLNHSDLEFWHENCPKFCDCMCEADGENVYTNVDCTNKNLKAIPEEFPINVKEINLENNAITSFSGFSAKNWTNLEILNVENNSLCDANLDLSPSMKVMKLAGNNLTRLPLSKWNTSSSFQLLTLSKNPWICDCQAWEFREWLVKYQNFINDVQEVRCSLQGPLSDRIIIQLQKEEMCPNSKFKRIAMIAGISVVVVIFCLLCCIFRKALAAMFYSCGCGCLKNNEKHDYGFDAFLLYADQDEDFALNIITEGLETRIPEIKLFIPTRQIFLSSSPVNIESSLADCCKVIVLLTKEFLNSAQCMQLLKASMSCSIQQSSKRFIFVLLGKGSILKDVDSTLKAIINNSVCLRCGEIFFWQKLRYFLPKRNKSRPVDEENNSLIRNEVCN
ncbi:Protein toll like protein [Argiope bruennichi]|uniref:Protein toll like protein n=1 Tax=Argiope bruennichi TaxID=94029 RepID=A0A8T0FCQ4_ARGBR|nr:Protein toll like protein [Argiope bruennichi]